MWKDKNNGSVSSEGRLAHVQQEASANHNCGAVQPPRDSKHKKYALPKNHGQRQELSDLRKALEEKLIIVLYGLGGIGKTTLLRELANNNEFEHTFIFEVKNKETFTSIAKKILRECFDETKLSDDEDELMEQLFYKLATKKVLIVIDNIESIMGIGENSGRVLPEYQGYSKFCNQFLETDTTSRLIMSGREMLELSSRYIERYEIIKMSGMDANQARKILTDLCLEGDDQDWAEFVEHYSGNPLELKIAAKEICDNFSQSISCFLSNHDIPHELNDLLEDQFSRFSQVEKVILYWCAVERVPIETEHITKRLTLMELHQGSVRRAFQNIRNHCFLERERENGRYIYSLQPVIQEFLSEHLIDTFLDELVNTRPKYFKLVPLIDTDSKEYILTIQKKMLVEPIQKKLEKHYGNSRSNDILKLMCDLTGVERSYSTGNVLSILSAKNSVIENWDFSNKFIMNADLRKTKIRNCDFRNTTFEHVLILYTFGNLIDAKFSYNDSLIIGGATDYNLYLWDSKDLSFRFRLDGHKDWIRSVDSNHRFIVSGSNDQTVRVYDANTFSVVNVFVEESRVRKVVLPKEADEFVYSSGDAGVINRWNTMTGACQHFVGHEGVIWNFILIQRHNTPYIVSVSDDGKAIVWDITDGCGTIIYTAKGMDSNQSGLRSVAYDDMHDRLFFGAVNGDIIVFSMVEEKVIKILTSHAGIVWSLDYDRNREYLISSSDKNIIVWNCHEGHYRPEQTLDAHGCDIWNAHYNSDCTKIISTADDYCFKLWDAVKYRPLNAITGYTNLLRCIFVSEVNEAIYVAGDDAVIREYKLMDYTHPKRLFSGHTNRVRHVDISSDGRMMLSCSDDKTVILWNLETGKKKVFYGHKKRVWSVCFIDGQQFASAGEENDIYIWDFNKDKPVGYLQGHEGWIWDITYSTSKGLLVSASEDKKCKLWNVKERIEAYSFEDHKKWLFGVSFDDTGRYIVTASTDGTAIIYDVESREKICILPKIDCWVWSAAFIEDDVVVTGGQDGSVRVFKIDFRQKVAVQLKEHKEHRGWVDSFAVSKKHAQFYSASADETVKAWSIRDYSYVNDFCIDKPYDKMRISGVEGLTNSELNSLRQLGAVD